VGTAGGSARSRPAAITGTVTGPDGHAVSGAAVEARDLATKALYQATSAASGEYEFAGLAAGAYTITVPEIGVTYSKFASNRLVLKPSQILHLDIRLDWGVSLGTAGDDAHAVVSAVRRRAPAPTGPTPRTPEGHPDLSGVWLGSDDPKPEEPTLLPWAAAVMQKRKALDKVTDNPGSRCLPTAVPLAGVGVYKIAQTPALLLQMFEDVVGYRQVFLDGRPHPKDVGPSWAGHSIGHWEGDTLAIDTIGFNNRSWLNLYPHTEKLHIVESYRRADLGHLRVQITIEDPDTFLRPWKIQNEWVLAPDDDVLEYVCNENNKDLLRLTAK